MKKDSRYVWYIIDGIIFTLIVLGFYRFFPQEIGLAVGRLLDPFMLVLFALGVWRLADIITHEKVTDFIRAPFMTMRMKNGEEEWVSHEKGFKGFCAMLVSCNSCMGVWVSLITFYLFVFFPLLVTAFMVVMTLTCFERFLSKIYNVLEKRG